MTTNITSSNPLDGHNGQAGFIDPNAIAILANQFYAALPQAESGVGIPIAPGVAVPQSYDSTPTGVALPGTPASAVPAAPGGAAPQSLDTPPGVGSNGTLSPTVPTHPPGDSTDPLATIAQQLYCQMRGQIEPQLQQALAGLTPSFAPPPVESPTALPVTGGELPTGNLPSDRFDLEAITRLAQDIYGQINSGNSPVEMPIHPAAIVPASPAELQRGATAARSPSSLDGLHFDTDGVPFDVHVIRRDFPILHQQVNGKPLIWLDNAATTQKPQSVIDSLSHYYQRDNSNIHRAAHTLAARATDAYEGAREKVQRFLGASDSSEIVFARGTTEAINLVAQTFGRKYIKQGDEIILSTLEHHANIVPWQMLAQETGAVIKVIPITDRGEIIMEEYTRLLSPRTRLVSVTQVSNALGTIVPVAEITHLAHRHGARVLIDGAQAVSHMPVDVQAIDCDFYVFSGHKLFAPTGIGALYAKQELLADLPPWQGGGSMIRHVTFERTIYSDPPAKFEAGTPNIADAVGLGAAIDYITRLGITNIERYEHQLTDYAMAQLAPIPGLHLIGTAPHKVSVVSFILENMSTERVGQILAQEGIAVRAGHHCAQPTLQRYGLEASVRPSLAFYNTHAEIDRLVEVVKNIRHL